MVDKETIMRKIIYIVGGIVVLILIIALSLDRLRYRRR